MEKTSSSIFNSNRSDFQNFLKLLRAGLFLLPALLLIGAHSHYGKTDARITVAKDGSIHIICLGESTTALGGRDSYPTLLGERLEKNLPGKKIFVWNLGEGGGNTESILKNLPKQLDEYQPSIALIMMGVNDSWNLPLKNEDYLPFSNWRSLRLAQMALV